MKSFTRLALVAACSVALYTVACGGKADAPPAAVDPAPAKAEAPAEAEAPAKAEADKGEAPKKLAVTTSAPTKPAAKAARVDNGMTDAEKAELIKIMAMAADKTAPTGDCAKLSTCCQDMIKTGQAQQKRCDQLTQLVSMASVLKDEAKVQLQGQCTTLLKNLQSAGEGVPASCK